jgi:hypothetical protein
MNKLARIINELGEEDLNLIKKDLEEGNIQRLVNEKLREHKEADWNKVCPICHSAISDDSFVLIFGPKDLRKRASFCAVDCMEYFLQRIKEQKVKNIRKLEGGIKDEQRNQKKP